MAARPGVRAAPVLDIGSAFRLVLTHSGACGTLHIGEGAVGQIGASERPAKRRPPRAKPAAGSALRGVSPASILDAIGSVIVCLSTDHRILEWNASASRIYGRSRDEVLGKNYVDLFVPESSRREFEEDIKKVLSGQPARSFENPVRGRNGQKRILLWSVARLRARKAAPLGVVACGQDITPRKRAREHLKVSRARLRDLSNHLNTVREEERARVARQVHDHLGQSLAALVMGLSRLEDDAREAWDPIRGEAVRELRSLAESTIEAAHAISSSLRPAILDDLGLEAAIEWEARRFQDQTGIRCVCRLQRGIRDPEPTRRTAVFRIFKELLTNVARHAQAARVGATLRHAHDWLILDVKDDGRGIRTSEIDARRSLGILGMQERAGFWGGEITFRGDPGRGTSATLRIPLALPKKPARRKRARGADS